MTKEKRCNSCKTSVTNDITGTSFACPTCSELVVRCGHCRKTAVQYKCSCGFEGP